MHNEGNYKQGEKTALRMGKIIANEAIDKELISKIYKQLMQQQQQQTHEKMLNITHYQRNANQYHNEVPSHTSQNGCYQKVYKQ